VMCSAEGACRSSLTGLGDVASAEGEQGRCQQGQGVAGNQGRRLQGRPTRGEFWVWLVMTTMTWSPSSQGDQLGLPALTGFEDLNS
jgi:hypothetical protein